MGPRLKLRATCTVSSTAMESRVSISVDLASREDRCVVYPIRQSS
jgi:hypothetical protein